jgi:hypothetical protein
MVPAALIPNRRGEDHWSTLPQDEVWSPEFFGSFGFDLKERLFDTSTGIAARAVRLPW